MIRQISLNKFREGGVDILMADRINHQNASAGNIDISPLVRKIFRVFVAS